MNELKKKKIGKPQSIYAIKKRGTAAWEKCTLPNANGGFAIRRLEDKNKVFLKKFARRILTDNSLHLLFKKDEYVYINHNPIMS